MLRPPHQSCHHPVGAPTIAPSAVKDGTSVTVLGIATTNVAHLQFGYGMAVNDIAQTRPGQWQSTFAFSSAGILGSSQVQFILKALRTNGAIASIAVPITITH